MLAADNQLIVKIFLCNGEALFAVKFTANGTKKAVKNTEPDIILRGV